MSTCSLCDMLFQQCTVMHTGLSASYVHDVIIGHLMGSKLISTFITKRTYAPFSMYGLGDVDGEGIERTWVPFTPFIGKMLYSAVVLDGL